MTRLPSRSGEAGFSLIEVLAAMLLMTFIMGALATITAQWLPNWNHGVDRTQRVELFATGLDRLVADLGAAEWISEGGGQTLPIFDGDALSVTFVRTAIGPSAGTGLEVVRLGEMAGDDGLALVRMTAPFMPDGSGGSINRFRFAHPVVVIRAPYRASFSYAGADRVWHDTWRQKTKLPRAVRITVRDAATSRTLAVTTATPIHVELPASCVGPNPTADCPPVRNTSMNAAVPSATASPNGAAAAPPTATPQAGGR